MGTAIRSRSVPVPIIHARQSRACPASADASARPITNKSATRSAASSGVIRTPRSTAARSSGNSAGATVKSMGSIPSRLRYTASPGASRSIHPTVNQPKAPRTDLAPLKPGIRTFSATGSSGSLNILGRRLRSSRSTSTVPSGASSCASEWRPPQNHYAPLRYRRQCSVPRGTVPSQLLAHVVPLEAQTPERIGKTSQKCTGRRGEGPDK